MLLVGLPAHAALDCNSIFPGPIQSHDSAGTLYMQSGARVEGYNGLDVCFKQVTGYDYEMSSQACGAGKCQITGIASLKQARPNFPGSTDSANYTVAHWTTPTVILGTTPNYGKEANSSRWDLGSLTIDGSVNANGYGNVRFSDKYSTYVIKSLTMQNGGLMTLTAGKTYIIEGDLTLTEGSLIKLVGSGSTSFYVKGNMNAHNDSQLQTGSAFKAYVVGSITLTGSDQLAGSYYAEGDATLENQVVLRGQLSAKNVNLKGNSKVIYDSGEPLLACFSDDFSASTLSSDWVAARSSGDFTPAIVNGRLGMTQASPKQSTSATYQRLFPAANNLVTIEFDHYAHGGNGADGMAVVLSDARVTPQPGAFGGPLGYGFKPEANGFAGGWLGVGIDEYGNFSGEGGSVNKGRRKQSVAVRGSGSGTSGYNYLKGTCNNGADNANGNCLSPTVDSGSDSNRPHRYRLTIDSRITGQSLVKVERNTGGVYSTLIDSFNAAAQSGQAAIPENLLLSLTGSTGDATNAHQIDNVRICALKSNPVGTQIDHFEFDHSGQALTCNPETLVIRACANASCSQLFTDPVSAILTPLKNGSNGWIADSQVSYNGNTATVNFSNGTAKLQLRNNLATAITVGVSGSTPSTKPLSTTLCRAGSGALSAAACTLSFADSGFLFNVPDTLANRPQQVVMKAVKKDDASQQCVPSFAGVSKPVRFWSDYVSPASNTFGSKVTVNGNAIATSQGASTTSNLSFDSKGETTLTVSYPDAGQMRLNARHDGSGDTAGLVITGSDLFVSRPVGLCITPIQGTCSAGDITCPVFKRTGDSFSLNIQAMAWQSDSDGDICTGNGTTPNFVLSDIALTSELVAPQGGVAAQVTPTRYSHVAASASLNTPALSLNEVGVFRIKATPPVATSPEGSTVSTGYFGYSIPPATSVPLGRFVPWDFNMTSGTVTPACGGFSYMSQPFGVQTVVEARNKEGSVTRNYRDAFARGALTLVAANNQDGVDRSNRLAPLAASWTEGTGKQSGQTRFMRLRELTPSLTAPEEPLPHLRLGLRVTDGETPETSFLSGRNMNPAVSGNCQSGVNCTARQLSILQGENNTMIAYYGRLLASTRQGAASAPLALPLQVQYFEGGLWRANSQDRRANSQDICTQISLAGGGIVFTDAEQRYDSATGDLILKDGTRIRLGLGNVAPGGTQVGFDAGETRFHFAAPNQSVRIPYEILLDKQPSQPVWLADPATADHLLGEAIFGRDRGNDRIIYRREVMP
ncbi:MSHA biogenesis protein MshQ [Aeromonas caviae]|nr:MSHA biogenesis protein MshQ [Aeromonas caviae]